MNKPTIPGAFTIPFNTRPTPARDEQGRELKPYVIIGGLSMWSVLDTPEKIGGLQKPLPLDIRHATLTSERPYDMVELHDYGTSESGPIHGHAVVSEGTVKDILGRIESSVIVGYTPEALAEELKSLVLQAFRQHPDYREGKPLNEPTPVSGT